MQGGRVAYVFHFCGLVKENNKRTAGGGGVVDKTHTYKGDCDPVRGKGEYNEKRLQKVRKKSRSEAGKSVREN